MLDVLGANILRAKEPEEGRAGGGFDRRTAIGFFALHQADHSNHMHSRLARGFNGHDGRGARGADIIDNDDRRTGLGEALDAACGSMRFFLFANEKAVDHRRSWRIQSTPGAGRGGMADDRVGSERESSEGARLQAMLANEIEDSQAGKPAAFAAEGGGAAIDVVVALAARGKLEIAQAEGVTSQCLEQGVAVGKS